MKFLFVIPVAAVICCVKLADYRRRKPKVVSGFVEQVAIRALEHIDEEEVVDVEDHFEPLEDDVVPKPRVVKAMRRGRFAAHVANVVRARLGGCPKRTGANMLVVQRMVRDYMKELNVRESHMPMHAPKACLYVFVPNKHDVAASQLAGTFAIADRAEQVGGWGHVRTPWWGSLPLIGRFAAREVHTDGFAFSERT